MKANALDDCLQVSLAHASLTLKLDDVLGLFIAYQFLANCVESFLLLFTKIQSPPLVHITDNL